MKKIGLLVLVGIIMLGVTCGGCAKKADSSRDAIDTAKAMEGIEKQVNYLEGQAQAFMNSKEYKDAVDVAQYVLNNLDKESAKAKKLLEDAKAELSAALKSKLPSLK